MTLPGHAPQDLLEAALEAARCDGAIAYVHASSARNVRFASNKVTTSGEFRKETLSVIAICKDGTCALRSEVSSVEEAVELMGQAEHIAMRSGPPADAYALYEGTHSPRFEATPTQPHSEDFFDFASDSLEAIFRDARALTLDTFGYIEDAEDAIYLATSSGCRDAWFDERSHFGITARTDQWKRSTWSGQTGTKFSDLDPIKSLERCSQLLDISSLHQQMSPGQYRVVLSRSCVADMLIWMYWLMALRDANEGKSVFADRKLGGNRLGDAICPPFINLRSDPQLAGLECIPFVVTSTSSSLESVFDNGMPVEPVMWIENGSLENLVTTRSYAAKEGVKVTPFTQNLILDGGQSSSMELVREVEHGLLINCLWYIRMVDPQSALLTGLTRDGVYVIKDGEIVAETNNFRFNMSPVEMLARAENVGESRIATPREFDDVGIRVQAPPIVTNGWHMSSVSDAL